MSRTKKEIEYLTEDQVDQLLREQIDLEASGENIRNAAESEINEIKAQMELDYAPIKLRLTQIKTKIFNYLAQHALQFLKPRSRDLRFGVIGFRLIRSDKIKVDDEDAAIRWCKENDKFDLIRTKDVLDLDAIAKLLPEEFSRIDGLSRPKEKDNPWFETKRETLPVA